MYKNGKYRETDKMSDLICENYPMVLVMSRFGIALGFGEKNIGEVCRQNGVDACTFLTVVNFLTEEISAPVTNVSNCLSIEALITYLHNAHDYFLNFRLPHLRRKLLEAIAECPQDVAFVIQRFFDEYADEVNKHMSYEEKSRFPVCPRLAGREKRPEIQYLNFPQTARPDRDEDYRTEEYPHQILSGPRKQPVEQRAVRHLRDRTGPCLPQPCGRLPFHACYTCFRKNNKMMPYEHQSENRYC